MDTLYNINGNRERVSKDLTQYAEAVVLVRRSLEGCKCSEGPRQACVIELGLLFQAKHNRAVMADSLSVAVNPGCLKEPGK